MPIIKSAKKRVKQAEKKQIRNYTWRAKVKTYMRKVLDATKKGDKTAAEKYLKEAYSVIDTALKKNILHRNNAARKKSLLARAVKGAKDKVVEPKVVKKVEEPKKAPEEEKVKEEVVDEEAKEK